MKYFFLALIIVMSGCSTKEYISNTPKLLILKTPKIKFSDIAYIHKNNESVKVDLYMAGQVVKSIEIARLICVSKEGCISKSLFNKLYLNSAYPDTIMKNLFLSRPIYKGINLHSTQEGFIQEVNDSEVSIQYTVTPHATVFRDRKNHILIKIKDIANGK